ncbi:unnamed protein product [Bemisia tabaci]|nr:unnamed protein product [Bemisia tabaci]
MRHHTRSNPLGTYKHERLEPPITKGTTKVMTNLYFHVSSGAEWRFRRNITNPSFRTNVLMLFDDNIYHHSKVFVDQLGQHAGGGEVDIFVPVHLCYIDMTIENMCGIQLGGQENRLTRLSTAMSGVAEIIVERTFSILLWTDFVYSLTGKMKLLNQLVDENQSVPRSPKIYLDRLLDGFDAGGLTKDQIVADVLDLFFAGTITAAITTSWVFKYLALYPDTQERAYQEIKETCVDGEVKLNDVSKLTYIEMIIKETLRHVGTPLTSRNLTEDVKVRGNMTIPAGTNVVMCFHELHHDSQYWQRPGEFYPEHFSPANERRRPKGAFNAFLSGPRICPGNKYAMRAMVFLIASTLLRYKFSTDEKPPKDLREMEYRYVFMLYPLSGFRVKIRQR